MNHRDFWFALGGAALVTGLACAGAWYFAVAPLNRSIALATTLRSAFEEKLNLSPRIDVENTVVFAQNTPVLELATVRREALVRHELMETWLGSTKEFEIEAVFTARAGFRLDGIFAARVRGGAKQVEFWLPRAEILGLEMGDIKILKDEDGLWNKIKPRDREQAIRALKKNARRQFLATDMLDAAVTEARARIKAVCEPLGITAVFPEGQVPIPGNPAANAAESGF